MTAFASEFRDVVLIGAGIMSTTFGTLLKELEPKLDVVMFEVLDDCALENSESWNNAGTGHAANCELNYTPRRSDGAIDISEALRVNTEFDLSLQLWSYLVNKGTISRTFVYPSPHMSLVWGDDDVAFLRDRYRAMSQHHCFFGMEYSEDPGQIGEWVPLVMEGRSKGQVVAATRVATGTDVDYDELTHALLHQLEDQPGFAIHYREKVVDLERREDGRWNVTVEDIEHGSLHTVAARFVFIGAGGGALRLLQRSGISEGQGYEGFSVTGVWLRCDIGLVSPRHHAKVYGRAREGSSPMSVPHFDSRTVAGNRSLIFGPFSGFSSRFLRNADWTLPIETGNVPATLAFARANWQLAEYLIGQVLQTGSHQFEMLREFYPKARREDWHEAAAGQRLQIIRPDTNRAGVLEFGTELVASADNSIAAVLGASPGASASVSVALDVLEKCFEKELAGGWSDGLSEIIPTYGIDLTNDADLCRETRTKTAAALGIRDA